MLSCAVEGCRSHLGIVSVTVYRGREGRLLRCPMTRDLCQLHRAAAEEQGLLVPPSPSYITPGDSMSPVLTLRPHPEATPTLCRIAGCMASARVRGLCDRHHHQAREAKRLDELGLPARNAGGRRPGPQPRSMPAPVAVEPQPPVVVEPRPSEPCALAQLVPLPTAIACAEISELISGGEVGVADLPRAITAILEQRDEARAKLAAYDRILETCDTPAGYLTGELQLGFIVGQWRQLGDPSGKHYRAWLALDNVRCAVLDAGHPLGDDSDPELTPLRLVQEVLTGLKETHRALRAVTGQRDALLAERQRICEALDIGEHPEPAAVARTLRDDLDVARAQAARLLHQESEMARVMEAWDGQDLVKLAQAHRQGILELTTAQHRACEALGGIPQGDVVELAKKAMAERAEALFELTRRQSERQALAQALQVYEEADLVVRAVSIRRDLEAWLEWADEHESPLGPGGKTDTCEDAWRERIAVRLRHELALERELEAERKSHAGDVEEFLLSPRLTRKELTRRLTAYDAMDQVELRECPEELREAAEATLRAHFHAIVWAGLEPDDDGVSL